MFGFACRGGDGDGEDWKRGKLVNDKGFLWSRRKWVVEDVEDWRDNITLETLEFAVR